MILQSPRGPIELRLEVPGRTITEPQKDRLERTLFLLPSIHFRGLRHIAIRDRDVVDEETGARRPYAGGSTNAMRSDWADQAPGARRFWIMIDIDSFSPRHRRINNHPGGYHYTLLHEMGHVADWSFAAFRTMRTEDPDGFRAISRRSHVGITRGAQEKFADAYADFFFYPLGNRARDERSRAVLRSAAFASVPYTSKMRQVLGIRSSGPPGPTMMA